MLFKVSDVFDESVSDLWIQAFLSNEFFFDFFFFLD